MTNREWLNSLSNEDFVKWILEDYTRYYDINKREEVVFAPGYSPCMQEVIRGWTSSSFRLAQWLDEERELL